VDRAARWAGRRSGRGSKIGIEDYDYDYDSERKGTPHPREILDKGENFSLVFLVESRWMNLADMVLWQNWAAKWQKTSSHLFSPVEQEQD
jgi:hypothetical protein